jgi:hypothetical protein
VLTLDAAFCVVLVLALFSCGSEPYDECHPAPDPYGTHYSPRPDVATPLGVRVDRSGQNVDLNRVDQAVAQVEACLGRPIEAHCLRVYVPTAWQMSCHVADGGHYQLLSEHPADQRACDAKPEIDGPAPGCPCLWRVLRQGATIIAPPDLRMLPAGIVSVATGIDDPWPTPLAACAVPLQPLPGE